jgi:tape measure domain-containing protein
MADYDAKIRVSADTSAAERSLQNFETKLNGLVAGLDIGKKVGRSFTEAFVAPKQLKQIDRELATIASRADTVAKRFARVVEGVGTVGVAAKGIADVGDALQQLSINAGQAVDQVNNFAKLKQALVPGFGAMQASVSTLAKTISTLEYKFSSLVPGAQGIVDILGSIGPQAGVVSAAVAAIGVAFETVLKGRAKQLETEVGTVLKTINDQTQQLLRNLEALNLPLGGTVRQFQNLLRTGEERLANVSSYSNEASRALSTILTAEMRLTAELQRQAVLRREMEASRFASVAQRTGMQFTFGGPKALPMAGQTAFQGAMRGGLGGGARSLVPSQTEMLVNAAGGRASRSGIEARATTASLQFGTKLSTEVDKLNALSAAEKARTKEINARLLPAFNEQRVREGTVKILNNEVKLNESNLRIEQALNGERARGVRFLEKQTAEEQRQVQLGILGQKTNRLPGQIGGPGFPSAGPVPLGMYGQGRTPAGGRRGGGFGRAASGALSNAAVGGAFPLLFGQSGSAAAGGAIGGIAGSLIPGIGGFGGSLIGTIIGEKAGQGNKIKELGADIGFSAEQTKLLSAAFQQAGRDFDKFDAAVQNIRGLSLAVNDQAKAIQLVSTLTKNYGGQIDKVTNAFTSALESGKVSQATLNQLTSQGVPIQQALADKYKVSRDTILEMAKDGKISVQDLIDTLVDLGNKGPAEITKNKTTMEKLLESVNNLGTALGNLGTNLVKTFGPIFKWLTDRVTDFINAISRAISRFGDLQFNAGKMTQITLKAEGTAQAATTKKYGVFARAYKPEAEAYFQQQRTNELKKLSPGSFKAEEKTKPLESFSAPAQMAATGKKDNSAEKAAKAAEREAARVANIVRDQAALTQQKQLQAQYSQAIFTAEIAKDEVLKIQLQREREIGEISLQYSKQINDEKAKGNSAAVKEAFTKTALVDVQLVELKTAQQLAELQIKTTEAYTNIATDLQYQLDLKAAVTEQDRIQLQLAYEAAKLRKDNPLMTQEQIDAITKQRASLAAPKTDAQSIAGRVGQLQDEIKEMTKLSTVAITAADGIGNAFANSFKSLIDGTMSAREALSSFFKDVASMFLDMAAQIIAKQMTMIILQSILKALGAVSGAGSGGDLGKVNMADVSKYSAPLGYAKGGVFGNGISKFASGGIVGSPTLFQFANGGTTQTGLMGEAGPEAIMPLSRGAGGKLGVNASGLREAMGGGPGMGGSPVLNMSFETTRFGDTDYVSRDQLEAAMAQTRRQASSDGAKRGMSMTLDRLQQSPQTRSRVGLR